MAAQVGIRRQVEALKKNLPNRHGYEGDGWSIHIRGAIGELAVAKAMGWYWDGSVNTFHTRPDVGRVEVRNRSNPKHALIHRPDDDPSKAWVLVSGTAPYLWVRGWMPGADCRQSGWWEKHGDRPYAWFVPIEELHPMKELREVAT